MASSSAELLPNILDDIKLAETLFREDRVLESFELLNNIERFVKSLDVEIQAVVENKINSSEVAANIRTTGGNMTALLKLLNETENWSVWNSNIGINQDVTVSTHKNEEKGQYYFKIEGFLHCDMLYAIAALLEHDLYQYWLPLCSKAQCLSKVSAQRRIMKADFDFTLLKKESIFNVYADIMQDGGVLFHVQSVIPGEESSLGVDLTTIRQGSAGEESSRHLRMDINGGILLHGERSAAGRIARENATKNLIRANHAPRDIASKQLAYEQLFGRIALSASSASGGGPGVNSRVEYHASKTLHSHHDDDDDEEGGLVGDKQSTNGRVRTGSGESKVSFQSTASVKAFESSTVPSSLSLIPPVNAPSTPAVTVPPRRSLASTLLFSPREKVSTTPSNLHPATGNATPAVSGVPLTSVTGVGGGRANTSSLAGGEKGRGARSVAGSVVGGGKEDMGATGGGGSTAPEDVFVTAVFVVDPRLDFVPDWIFNMAVKSAVSTFIPSLEAHALQFAEDGVHDGVLDGNLHLYSEIEARLNEFRSHQNGANNNNIATKEGVKGGGPRGSSISIQSQQQR